jgi:DNA ligase (NAD+)
MFQKERTYLKWKYLYYNGQTEVSDATFDKLEDELRSMGSLVVLIKDSPNFEILKKYNLLDELTVGERGIRFSHEHPMLSLRKFQVTMDTLEKELFPLDIVNFFTKVPSAVVNCTPKFDGNSMELIYVKGVLTQALTRGNEFGGLDRTENMKIIVPNTLPTEFCKYDKITVRGEVIIPTEIWTEKYSDPNKVDNPRNWLAGFLNSDEVVVDIMKDIDFVGYHIIINDGGNDIKPTDQLGTIVRLGFQEIFNLNTTNYTDFFKNVYPKFKDYRATSKYALDGIVLSFSANHWDSLGSNDHHPYWSCAVKFPPNRVMTYLEDVLWKLGKDGEYTPIALFKPVELDGTVVKHASMHNLGWIIDNKVFPGCKVEIAKKGEIIPQLLRVVEESTENELYQIYLDNFIKTFKE